VDNAWLVMLAAEMLASENRDLGEGARRRS